MKKMLLIILFVLLLPSVGVSAKKKDTTYTILETQIAEQARRMRDLTTKLVERFEAKKKRQEEIKLLAEVMYWENWYTDKDKRAAYLTAAVVLNRVKSKGFPDTIEEVLYQKKPLQYSTTQYFFTKELPQECYELAEQIYDNGTPDVPENVLFQSQNEYLGRGNYDTINGEYFNYG